jgi:hypothetical protein
VHRIRNIPLTVTAEQAEILKPIRQKAALCRKSIVKTATEYTRETKKWTILAAVLATAMQFVAVQQLPASQNRQPDCRIDAGSCVKTAEGLSVILDITPKPLKVMRDLTFLVTVTDRGKPVTDASVQIDLTMPGMFMGKNVVRLSHRADGVYEGKGVIIRCPSGEKIWQASVTIQQAAKKTVLSYVFEVP